MNKKSIIIFAFTLISLILSLNLTLAYSYSHPGYSYNYPSLKTNSEVFPSFQNSPTISDRSSITDNSLTQYNRIQQPQILEEKERYDEYFKIGRNGRVIRTVSSETTRRFIGQAITESYGQQKDQSNSRDYSLIPQNPTYFSGGSSFSSTTPYNYFYSPRYSNLGYYNWGYNSFY